MFPQPTLPKRLYVYAGLSLLALGYCAGRSCSNEPQQLQQPLTQQTQQPISISGQPSSLEQTVTKTEQQPLPAQQSRPLTAQQRLARLLDKRPTLLPDAPEPQYHPRRQTHGFFADCKRFLRGTVAFGREIYQEITGEVDNCLQETKEKVEDIYRGK